MDLAQHTRHLARLGQPVPLVGRLLMDRTWAGRAVALDAAGNEAAPSALVYVLSDEGEATDGNIVRQEWNLDRATSCGLHVLWSHQMDQRVGSIPLGLWQDFQVLDGIPGAVGRSLLATADLDEIASTTPLDKADLIVQARAKRLRGVSIGWIPGAMTPRGQLPPEDPAYRDPQEDFCGDPAEGFVMGTPEQPNELIEASLTPTPAQPRAHARARLVQGAERGVNDLLAGRTPTPGDLSRVLAVLGSDARVIAWARRLIQAERQAATPPSLPATLGDLFSPRGR